MSAGNSSVPGAFANAGVPTVFGSRNPQDTSATGESPATVARDRRDEQDRATVEALIEAVGLRPMYLGDNQQDTVDGVLRLWFALAVGQGHGRHLAFHTLTR